MLKSVDEAVDRRHVCLGTSSGKPNETPSQLSRARHRFLHAASVETVSLVKEASSDLTLPSFSPPSNVSRQSVIVTVVEVAVTVVAVTVVTVVVVTVVVVIVVVVVLVVGTHVPQVIGHARWMGKSVKFSKNGCLHVKEVKRSLHPLSSGIPLQDVG